MRPLRLEMEGLRSYRKREEIDFRDKNLVAIVGNTGAGKSSILEAIIYALYNASSWDERSVEALIADGQTKMEVVFEFEIGGRTWQVRRATNRGGYPPSQHKLVCLSDETVSPLVHERAIKKEISRILGLTYDGFKSAILLPQGKFQALLTAKDRTGILKEVFRLDVQVDAIRKGAAEVLERTQRQLDETTARRATLLPDPAAAAREAEARKDAAERRLGEAKDTARGHHEQKHAAEQAEAESMVLERRRTRLAEALHGDAAILSELVTIQEEIQGRRLPLAKQKAEASAAEEELAASLQAAEHRGEGLAALSAAHTVLERLKSDQPAIASEKLRLDAEDKAIQEADSALGADAARSAQLERAVTASEAKLKDANSSADEAKTAYSEAKLRLAAARAAGVEASNAERQLGDARSRLLSAADQLVAGHREALGETARPSLQPETAREEPAAFLAELANVEDDIRDARQRLEERQQNAVAHEAELAAALREADEHGEGVTALVAAEGSLGRLKTDLPDTAVERQRLRDEEKRIEVEAAELGASGAGLKALSDDLNAAEAALEQATGALASAKETRNEAKVRLGEALRTQVEADAAEQVEGAARAAVAPAEAQVALCARAHQEAGERARAAQVDYEAAQRLHAAAHASAGLHGGDPCPICTRPLPDAFVPPQGDEGIPQARLKVAQKDVAETQRLLAEAASELKAKHRAVQEKEAVSSGRRDQARSALTALQRHLPDADLADRDASVLAPLAEVERTRQAGQEEAQKTRDAALGRQRGHEATLAAGLKSLEQHRQRYREAIDVLSQRTQRAERERATVPVTHRPPADATAAAVEEALQRVRERLKELKDVADQHEQAMKTRDAVSRAVSSVAKQQIDLDAARAALREKESAATTRRNNAAMALGRLREVLPTADLETGDPANLVPLVDSGKAARAAQEEAQRVRDAALSEQQGHDRSLATARKALAERRTQHAGATRALAQRVRTVERDRVSLPDALRPAADAGVVTVEVAQATVREGLARLRDLTARRERAAEERENADQGLAELAKEETTRVIARDREAWSRLGVLSDRVAELGTDSSPPPPPAAGATLSSRRDWASALETHVHGLVRELQERAQAARAAATQAIEARDSILADGGFGTREELERAISMLAAEALAAQGEERKALGQVPLARALDERIGPATGLRNALFELGRLLNDGKFVKFVVERRQKALLAVASTILQSMTRNHYGFAADFRVVDMVTNQARPVETLSGGETFLASLALALGLVELAGRSGGRVDSLILDEGFASLDTSALTCALDELERRAGSGKLVALVSHLGAVADMAPEVLYVLQRDGSSVARWRSDGQDDPELNEVDAHLHRN
jgi:exonuclease SbcC